MSGIRKLLGGGRIILSISFFSKSLKSHRGSSTLATGVKLTKGAQFDSRKMLNQLIGGSIQFIFNPLITAEVVSDSRVLFEGKEWALGPLTKELKERSGVQVSKTSNFHGASYWSWDGTRLVDLDI